MELGFYCCLDERLVDPTDITDAILGCDISLRRVLEKLKRG